MPTLHATSYHPQHNCILETCHRRLKDALRAATYDFSWVNRLPLIMLNLHVALRDDGQPSPAEIVYGISLTMPVDLVVKSNDREDNPQPP